MALLLAVIGLYGVISYNVARRRNEIGIRLALGAQQRGVVAMVMREVVVLIASGLALGLFAAALTTRFVASLVYGLEPNDPLTFTVPLRLWRASVASQATCPRAEHHTWTQ